MTTTVTWRDLLHEATERLGSAAEARWLVERASGFEGTDYALGLGEPVSSRAAPFFASLLERRAGGEPLQYVLGRWGFRRLDLFVDRRVLIPRPETEMVVQVALAELASLANEGVPGRTGHPGPRRRERPRAAASSSPSLRSETSNVVDLGTGSGAIALSIAVEAPTARVWATDASADALVVAELNLAGIGTLAAGRVRMVQGSWFEALPSTLLGRVQLVVSNPPYVAETDALPDEVAAWEPRDALRAGPTGLEDIEQIVGDAPKWLARPGVLVVELAPHQAGAAVELAGDAGFTSAEIRLDLAGRERMLLARIS